MYKYIIKIITESKLVNIDNKGYLTRNEACFNKAIMIKSYVINNKNIVGDNAVFVDILVIYRLIIENLKKVHNSKYLL